MSVSADRIPEIKPRIEIENPILLFIKGSSRWALHNPIGQAVTGIVLSGLTIVGLPGCGTPEGGKNGPTFTATAAQKIDTPTPTPTPRIEATPTSTPESEFKFGEYDVFVGDGVVFAALPNGKLLFQAAKPEVTCDNPKYPLYKFLVAPPYTPGDFNYSGNNRSVTGKLVSPDTVRGNMSNREYTAVTPDGRPMTCPANSFPFTAQRVGKGQEAFLQAYREAMGYPATTSLTEIRVNINRAIALYGFELP